MVNIQHKPSAYLRLTSKLVVAHTACVTNLSDWPGTHFTMYLPNTDVDLKQMYTKSSKYELRAG